VNVLAIAPPSPPAAPTFEFSRYVFDARALNVRPTIVNP